MDRNCRLRDTRSETLEISENYLSLVISWGYREVVDRIIKHLVKRRHKLRTIAETSGVQAPAEKNIDIECIEIQSQLQKIAGVVTPGYLEVPYKTTVFHTSFGCLPRFALEMLARDGFQDF